MQLKYMKYKVVCSEFSKLIQYEIENFDVVKTKQTKGNKRNISNSQIRGNVNVS